MENNNESEKISRDDLNEMESTNNGRISSNEDNITTSSQSIEDLENLHTSEIQYDSKSQVFKAGILGVFIGLAVIVPGVSGSAVAIMFKMYESLLYSFSNIFKKFKKCFLFLLPILLGAVVGLAIGFFGIRALLNVLPFIVICFFAGLMFGAYPAVLDQIKGQEVTVKNTLLFLIGLIIPILISVFSVFQNVISKDLINLQFYHYIIFLVLGFLVALTQLVPGLSATAILMSVGYFTPLMNSVSISYFKQNPMIFAVYAMLGIGFLIGIFVVSKVMNKCLIRFRVPTFCLVAGLSLGSIVTMFFNPEVVSVYRSFGANMLLNLLVGVVVFVVGVILAYLFVRYERKIDKKNKS